MCGLRSAHCDRKKQKGEACTCRLSRLLAAQGGLGHQLMFLLPPWPSVLSRLRSRVHLQINRNATHHSSQPGEGAVLGSSDRDRATEGPLCVLGAQWCHLQEQRCASTGQLQAPVLETEVHAVLCLHLCVLSSTRVFSSTGVCMCV